MNGQALKRKIFDRNAKYGWIESAEGLQKAAEILKAARQPNQLYANTLWPELMLWGFCLENLFKGLYAKKQVAGKLKDKQAKPLDENGKLNVGKKPHDLEKWCQRAEVSAFASLAQQMILRNLTEIMIYHGRYPVSTEWDKSQPVYWSDEEHDPVLLDMIDFLKQEIEIL